MDRVINAIAPGTVKKINESKLPFKQMVTLDTLPACCTARCETTVWVCLQENISCFLQSGRALGLAEFDCFCVRAVLRLYRCPFHAPQLCCVESCNLSPSADT